MTAISTPEQGSSLSRAGFLGLLTATAWAALYWYLSKLDTGEGSREREAERQIERNKTQRSIAIVDDNDISGKSLAEFITRIVTSTSVSYYPICQDLLKDLESGKRYDLYVVDYNPGDTSGLWGDICTSEILIWHPGAVVIGQSMDDVAEEFIKAGARKFISRREGGMEIANIIKSLLP